MSELGSEPPETPPPEPTRFANPDPQAMPAANREQRPSLPLWGWIALTSAVALGALYVVAQVISP